MRCRHALRQFPCRLGKDRKKSFGCLPENVLMTTADGMHPAFSGRYLKPFFLISDLYRSLPTSNGNCRSALYPCCVNTCEFHTHIMIQHCCTKLVIKRTTKRIPQTSGLHKICFKKSVHIYMYNQGAHKTCNTFARADLRL